MVSKESNVWFLGCLERIEGKGFSKGLERQCLKILKEGCLRFLIFEGKVILVVTKGLYEWF